MNSDYEGFLIPQFIKDIDNIFRRIKEVGFQNISQKDKYYLQNNYKNHKEKFDSGYYYEMHQDQGQYEYSKFDIIWKFRNWFDGLGNTRDEAKQMRGNIVWGKAFDVRDLYEVIKNSGTKEEILVTKTIEEVEKQISKLIEEAHDFRFKNGQNQSHILSQFIKWTHLGLKKKNYEDQLKIKCKEFSLEYSEDLRSLLEKFHTKYKLPLIKEIKSYWRLKLNGDLSFNESFVKTWKFNPCSYCTRPDYIDVDTLDELTKEFGKKDN